MRATPDRRRRSLRSRRCDRPGRRRHRDGGPAACRSGNAPERAFPSASRPGAGGYAAVRSWSSARARAFEVGDFTAVGAFDACRREAVERAPCAHVGHRQRRRDRAPARPDRARPRSSASRTRIRPKPRRRSSAPSAAHRRVAELAPVVERQRRRAERHPHHPATACRWRSTRRRSRVRSRRRRSRRGRRRHGCDSRLFAPWSIVDRTYVRVNGGLWLPGA